MFRVIDCTGYNIEKKEKIKRKYQLIGINTQKNIEYCVNYSLQGCEIPKEYLKKLVYYGTKTAISTYHKFNENLRSEQNYRELLNLIEMVVAAVSLLTPREVLSFFPIEKTYNGEKHGVKDYQYGMDYIDRIGGMDALIGDNANMFVSEVNNPTLINLAVTRACIVDKLMRFKGKQGMIESFFGIEPCTIQTGSDSKNFLYDPNKQKTFALTPKRPRYLRVVK